MHCTEPSDAWTPGIFPAGEKDSCFSLVGGEPCPEVAAGERRVQIKTI